MCDVIMLFRSIIMLINHNNLKKAMLEVGTLNKEFNIISSVIYMIAYLHKHNTQQTSS